MAQSTTIPIPVTVALGLAICACVLCWQLGAAKWRAKMEDWRDAFLHDEWRARDEHERALLAELRQAKAADVQDADERDVRAIVHRIADEETPMLEAEKVAYAAWYGRGPVDDGEEMEA